MKRRQPAMKRRCRSYRFFRHLVYSSIGYFGDYFYCNLIKMAGYAALLCLLPLLDMVYFLDSIVLHIAAGKLNYACSYMVVDSSNHDTGEKARLQLPTMKENDTHCIDFSYLLYSQKGLNPGTLNILVRVNKGPLANPIWNVTGFTGRDWLRAELAVSTFWPNEYQ
ncbi:hypothetical protein STEG23_010442, partial [Scotinomys teguina]